MALALTPFQALCGFRPLPAIAAFLASTPEFAALVPGAAQDALRAAAAGPAAKQALRDVFAAVMTAEPALFQPALARLVARYKAGDVRPEEEPVKELVVTLDSQFPGDIGVFCAFMLNHMTLKPGEAIFLAAGEPHAYVSGGAFSSFGMLSEY